MTDALDALLERTAGYTAGSAAGAPAEAAAEIGPGESLSAAAALLLDDLVAGLEAGAGEGAAILPGDTGRLPQMEPQPATTPSGDPDDYLGAGQTLIVIDDGYSPFFDQDATVYEYDYYGFADDPDASVETLQSHGSWVAQTALRVAPELDIVHFKVFPDEGGSAYLSDIEQALAAAIDLAAEIAVAAVNLSLGYGNTTVIEMTQISDEIAALTEMGVSVVAAAGNDGASYPEGVSVIAADPNVIGVSATDDDGAFADFSQRDPALTDIAAPGVDIPIYTVNGLVADVSGTSFSAPYVSAAIARLQEAAEAELGGQLPVWAAVELLQDSGTPVAGEPVGTAAEGWRVADPEAALALFFETSTDYVDFVLI
ncbi:hypothetical protein LNKW23_36490 [Paralimibaculum aggregatum]|uniref:Peptidase S8/S53 domain-containing protein n=1 Tax=Paralimibaculum aggregatum TaxID=3036245 RepID=A0ABQ6LR92_9RHOB|nr:S8/S53 family peptidase [Limibaculum sp. NKW23]GMG84433.1 hypothetical protein LNKW23_36490 [Limibaculum sp. NKW23]